MELHTPTGSSNFPDLTPWSLRIVKEIKVNPYAGRATYLVEDVNTRRRYVAKLVFFNGMGWDEIRKTAFRELNALQNIDHPRVPRFIRLINEDTNDWIAVVQEYIDGVQLAKYSFQGADSLVSISRQLLQVLVHLKSKEIAHSDIKPENIMITDDGEAYLVDFGLSGTTEHTTVSLMSTHAGGTFGFTHPSLLLGTGCPSAKTDLYSLGCTLAAHALRLNSTQYSEQYPFGQSPKVMLNNRPREVSKKLWQWIVSLIYENKSEDAGRVERMVGGALGKVYSPVDAAHALDQLKHIVSKKRLPLEPSPKRSKMKRRDSSPKPRAPLKKRLRRGLADWLGALGSSDNLLVRLSFRATASLVNLLLNGVGGVLCVCGLIGVVVVVFGGMAGFVGLNMYVFATSSLWIIPMILLDLVLFGLFVKRAEQ